MGRAMTLLTTLTSQPRAAICTAWWRARFVLFLGFSVSFSRSCLTARGVADGKFWVDIMRPTRNNPEAGHRHPSLARSLDDFCPQDTTGTVPGG